MELLAAWHNVRDPDDPEHMAVFVRRDPSGGLCEVEVRTPAGPKPQEPMSEANAFALAAQIRRAARGTWQRIPAPATA
ncbi:hypothetical protein Lfu02_41210 [Longispora fulva]|nr:hypothetical protein Lfu02_41210 [Longispora fulva]